MQNLTLRVYSQPLNAREQQPFIDYLHAVGSPVTDQHVGEVLHLMMSTPRYQLC